MQNNPYEEYKILVSWLIHQHNRRNHHTMTLFTINLILIALIKLFEDNSHVYFFVLVGFGFIISLSLLIISLRITKEEELRTAQAREMEHIFIRSNIGGIFRTGYELFIESKEKYYKKANSIIKPPKFLGKIRVKNVLFIFNVLFIILYLFLIGWKIVDP